MRRKPTKQLSAKPSTAQGASAPYGGGEFLADTSAWTHASALTESDKTAWDAAIQNRQIATCEAVIFELSRGTRSAAEIDALHRRFSGLRRLQITNDDWLVARETLTKLAHRKAEYHRPISPVDALVAVVATRHGIGVLHYDRHFQRLAEVIDDLKQQPVEPF